MPGTTILGLCVHGIRMPNKTNQKRTAAFPTLSLTSTSSHNPAPLSPNGVGDVASPGNIKLSIPSPLLVAMLLHARPDRLQPPARPRCARTFPATPSLSISLRYYYRPDPLSSKVPLRPRWERWAPALLSLSQAIVFSPLLVRAALPFFFLKKIPPPPSGVGLHQM